MTGDQTRAPATAAGVGMEQKGCGRQKVADQMAEVEIGDDKAAPVWNLRASLNVSFINRSKRRRRMGFS